MSFTIRQVRPSDAEDVHRLSLQLGYEPTLELVKRNIEGMLSHPDYELVGIADQSDQIKGWMSLATRIKIEDTAFFQIAALVPDETHRGHGLGRRLVEYAESQARKRGLPYVGLNSSKRRQEAHAFYEHLGFQKTKESFYFRKPT